MTLRELPPQVAIVCDGCGQAMEYDGITLHFEQTPEAIESALSDSEWVERDGGHLCWSCEIQPPASSTDEGDDARG